MTILQSWKDSVQLLKPQNLKLFLLVTFNSFVQGWRALLNGYSLYILFEFIFIMIMVLTSQSWLKEFSAQVLGWGIIFLYCLAIRPSIERKTTEYFTAYFKKKFWYIALLLAGINFFESLILVYGNQLGLLNFFSINLIWLPSLIMELFFCKVFFIFFLLDSNGSARSTLLSVWRTCKMSIYNAPLLIVPNCIAIMLNNLFINKMNALIAGYVNYLGVSLLDFLLLVLIWCVWLPFYLCLIDNIYIKKLHEQFGLYFECPE